MRFGQRVDLRCTAQRRTGLDVRGALIDFHGAHYFAQQMKLAVTATICAGAPHICARTRPHLRRDSPQVLGPQDLSVLQEWVQRYFSGVRALPEAELKAYVLKSADAAAYGDIRLPEQLGPRRPGRPTTVRRCE